MGVSKMSEKIAMRVVVEARRPDVRQSIPVVLYGAASWSLPVNINSVYVQGIEENQLARDYRVNGFSRMLQTGVSVGSLRRIGIISL